MASANTLTNLTNIFYEAADIVARERVGSINAVTIDANAAGVAVGQSITSHVAPVATLGDITPGATAPDAGGEALGSVSLTINKLRRGQFQWTGEEVASVSGREAVIMRDQIAQRLRAFSAEISADINAAAKAAASRAYGVSGVTPFGTADDLSDLGAMHRILDDNGAPMSDRMYVGNGAVFQNLRSKHGILLKVNESGGNGLLQTGDIPAIEGFGMFQDRYVSAPVTVGSGASYVIDGTGNTAAGSTTLKLKTGTGTILAGDVITIGAFKYVVKTALTGGLVVINAPGLQAAAADGDAVTVNAAFTGNLAFHKSAILLAARTPLLPNGDAGVATFVTDPVTGLTYRFAHYYGYMQNHFELQLAWGVKAVKSEFIALNLG